MNEKNREIGQADILNNGSDPPHPESNNVNDDKEEVFLIRVS